MHAVTMEIGS